MLDLSIVFCKRLPGRVLNLVLIQELTVVASPFDNPFPSAHSRSRLSEILAMPCWVKRSVMYLDDSDDRQPRLDDWIGLRENLQETIDFPIKYGSFL